MNTYTKTRNLLKEEFPFLKNIRDNYYGIRMIFYKKFLLKYLITFYKRKHDKLIIDIQKRKNVKVIFFASSLGMWRYQELYNLLNSNKKFQCHIIVIPFTTYTKDDQDNAFDKLSHYFNDLNIEYIDGYHNCNDAVQWINNFNPDILFYSQPYENLFGNKLDEKYFRQKLLCYCPYGVSTLKSEGLYNTTYQNVAWKLFYPTIFNYTDAKDFTINHGENVIVVGDPNVDIIGKKISKNPWKTQKTNKKKIIWAPHFTIKPSFCLNRASFLWLNDLMLEIAEKYKDKIQIAFKPHPRLKTELYKYEGWGPEKTEQYYEKWDNGENTQLEEGDYKDLFTTSDAMIHDCGSFAVEYLYTNKPVLFIDSNENNGSSKLNKLGLEALNLHYNTCSEKGIINFIEDVINGRDPMRPKRETFYNKYLQSPNGKTVAQNIYESILNDLNLD